MKRISIAVAIILIISLGVLVTLRHLNDKTINVAKINSDKIDIGGDFSLVNANGELISSTDFRGKYMMIYFGFTYCPDVCPAGLQMIANSLEQLPKRYRDQVQPIFITVDPERDTKEQIGSYLADFDGNIMGLTGSVNQIENVAQKFKVYYNEQPHDPSDNDYLIDHSAFIYFMDKNGKYLSHFAHNEPADGVAQKVMSLIRISG